MKREATICLLAVVACAAGESHASVVGMFWEEEVPNTNIWNLYAAVDSAQTFVLTADLGDLGVGSTGLFSTMGAIISAESFVTIGSVNPSFARAFAVTPSGSGSMLDAAWFVTVDVFPILLPNEFSAFATQLGHFVLDPGAPGAFLGGNMGGPNSDIQSRMFVGWQDVNGVGFGLFDISMTPTPGSILLLALGAIFSTRRRRRIHKGDC